MRSMPPADCEISRAKRRAGIPMPDFDRVDAMPMRALAARQQKVDRGRRRAPIVRSVGWRRIAKRLAEMPAFRMRLEIEQPDHVGRGKRGGQRCRQKRFFRSRISANTFQAGLPPSPSDCATFGIVRAQETDWRPSPPRSSPGSSACRRQGASSPRRRARRAPCCAARWSWRSGYWRRYIRGRSKTACRRAARAASAANSTSFPDCPR